MMGTRKESRVREGSLDDQFHVFQDVWKWWRTCGIHEDALRTTGGTSWTIGDLMNPGSPRPTVYRPDSAASERAPLDLVPARDMVIYQALAARRPVARVHLAEIDDRVECVLLAAAYFLDVRKAQVETFLLENKIYALTPPCARCALPTGSWCERCHRPLCTKCDDYGKTPCCSRCVWTDPEAAVKLGVTLQAEERNAPVGRMGMNQVTRQGLGEAGAGEGAREEDCPKPQSPGKDQLWEVWYNEIVSLRTGQPTA